MQDLRIYKGVAKYNDSFVVPATSPDVLPETPSGVSGGSKLTKITDGAVSFDGSGDSLKVPDSSDLAFGTGEFTVEMFFYTNTVSGNDVLYDSRASTGSPTDGFSIVRNNDQLRTYTSGAYKITPSTFRVASNRWYHLAITRESTTQKMYIDGELVGSATVSNDFSQQKATIGSDVNKSENWDGFISNVRLIKGTALYTSRFTPPTRALTNVTNTKLLCCQSNSEGPQKTAVIPSATGTATAMWPLNSDIGDDSGNNNTLTENGGSTSFTSAASNSFGITNAANFAKDGKYLSYAVTPASAWTIDGYVRLETTTTSAPYILGWNGQNGSDTCFGFPSDGSRKFSIFGSSNLNTDVVAEIGRWYHIRMTTNSTSDLALYVDGVLLGRSTTSDGGPASPITIGDVQSGRFSGQIAGVRYTPTDLGAPPLGGETTSSGVTSNSPSVGVGLAGDVSATNFNPFNTDINTVRGQETGYPTFNPLDKLSTNTLSNGNLSSTASATAAVRATKTFPKTGKWYVEYSMDAVTTNGYPVTGISKPSINLGAYSTSGIVAVRPVGSGKDLGWVIDGTDTPSNYMWTGFASSDGDTMQIAYNADEGAFYMGVNNFWWGLSGSNAIRVSTADMINGTNSAKDVSNEEYFAWSMPYTNAEVSINFGQKPFKFSPPEGFQPLNDANVRPETVIARPDQYVGVTTYTGNNTVGRIIDIGRNADLVWVKKRTAENHILVDTVRGANNFLMSDSTNAANTSGGPITGIGATVYNGFIVDNNGYVNANNAAYVCWNWKAGGSKNTFNVDDVGYASAAAAGLDGGTATVTGASVGTKQGFSIIKYTTTTDAGNFTVSHGLSEAPKFIITRKIASGNWVTGHDDLGWTKYLFLNTTAAESTDANAWGNISPTSSVFGGNDSNFYGNGVEQISYIWHDVPGLQKFGTYEGLGGTANGSFVELGFRPAIVWVKKY